MNDSFNITKPDHKLPTHNEPIHPEDFADIMAIHMNQLDKGFYTGGKIREGFIQYGSAYNHAIDLNRNDKSVSIVLSALTGSCKTRSSRQYLSEISTMGLSGLLVVSEIDIALEAAAEINALAGREVAGVYYTISKEHPVCDLWCSLKNLPQIAIISHALFISRSDTGLDVDLIRSYKNKQRNLVIIDEQIDIVKRISFSNDELDTLIGILQRDPRLKDVVGNIKDFNTSFFTAKHSGWIDSDINVLELLEKFAFGLAELKLQLLKGGYNLASAMRGRKKGRLENDKIDFTNIIDLLTRISWVVSKRYTMVVEGCRTICHREEDLSSKFGSAVVLDATANCNPDYEYRFNNKHLLIPLRRVDSREYSNVTLNICEAAGAKQSNGAIYKTPHRNKTLTSVAKTYLKAVGEVAEPNDKILIASFKDMMPIFSEHNPYNGKGGKPLVSFAHWGSKSVRGSNEYRDYNKAVVIGWLRKPRHYYVSSVMAINDVDRYLPTTGSIWSDSNHLERMLIIGDIIQFVNRIRCRKAINSNGGCPPVEIFMFTGGDKIMKELLESTLKIEMPGINFKSWRPKAEIQLKRKATKVEERSERVAEYLSGQVGKYDEVTLYEIRQEFGFTKAITDRVSKSDFFIELLEDIGITFIPGKGRQNPAKFILPFRTA